MKEFLLGQMLSSCEHTPKVFNRFGYAEHLHSYTVSYTIPFDHLNTIIMSFITHELNYGNLQIPQASWSL